MEKLKNTEWKRVSFSMKLAVIDALNSIPRNEIPNKSKLVESLITSWLYKNNYMISGSL
jgi:hypothetical protein